MSVVENTKLDSALNFRTLQSTRSFPQFRKVYPANGGARNFTLASAGALQNVIFNVPAECVNMGESYLEYSYTIDAQAAGRYSWIYKDVHGEFDSVMYRDTGSMALVDVKNAHLLQQITNRLNFDSNYLEYNDNLNGLVPTNAPLTDVKSVRFDGNPCSLAFKEAQQMAIVSGAAALSSVIYKKVYLKDLLKDTYFGLAKHQILPIETYLELNFSNTANRVGFSSLSAVNPNSTPLAFINNINISGLVLNLCVEQNQEIVKMFKSEVAKGVNFPIPWVRTHQLAMSATANNFVYNLPLDNKQHGQRIKRIVYAPTLLTGAAANSLYDHQNLPSAPRIAQYQTELDNQKMQRDILYISATQNDDYMFHKKLLKDTLYFNQPIYNQNWLHVDSWDFGQLNDKSGAGNIAVDGLVLDKPMTWSFNCFLCSTGDGVTAVQLYNNAIVCGQKMLSVNESSFVVV